MIDEFSIPASHDSHDIQVDYLYTKNSSDKNNNTVIITHGNGSNRKRVYPYAEIFLENGYNVLCFDQRSFSYSDVDGRKVLKNCKTKDIPLLIINGKKDDITIDHKIFACYNAELRGFIAKKLDNKGFSAISI